MTLASLAVRNLARRKHRTLLTGLGVALASGTLFSILSFDRGYELSLREEVAGTGIHLFASTEGCPLEAASLIIHGGELPRFLRMERLDEIRRTEGVKDAAGFLVFSLPAPRGSRTDLFCGVSDDAPRLKPNWRLKGTWFKDDDSIILGSEVARIRKRAAGDKVFIESLGREFAVAGVLERTFGQDDGFHYLPLRTAQRHFRKEGRLTAVGVRLFDLSQLARVKDRLEALPEVYVVPAEDMSRRILELVGGTKALMYAVLAIALAVSALGLLNTVLMAAIERRREFGCLRCAGAGRLDLVRLVLLETLAICAAGGAAGILAGYALSGGVEAWLRGFLPYVPAGRLLRPDAAIAAADMAVIMALGVLAGAYPAWRASGVSPVEAVRDE